MSEPSSKEKNDPASKKGSKSTLGVGVLFGLISLLLVIFLYLGNALEPMENYLQMLIFQMGFESVPSVPELFILKKDSATSSKISEDIGRMDFASIIRLIGKAHKFPFPGAGSARQDLFKLELRSSFLDNPASEFNGLKLKMDTDSISLGIVQEKIDPLPFVSFQEKFLLLPGFLWFPPSVNPTMEYSGLPKGPNKSIFTEWWQFFLGNLIALDFSHRFKLKVEDGLFRYALSVEKSLPEDFSIPPAAVIGLDFILQGRRGEDDEEKLKILPEALATCEAPVILGAHIEAAKQEIEELKLVENGVNKKVKEGPENILVAPDPMFMNRKGIEIGMINVSKERGNVCRQLPIFLPHPNGNSLFPSFCLALAAAYLDTKAQQAFPGPVWTGLQKELARVHQAQKNGSYEGGIWLNGKFIPTDKNGNMLIKFIGSTGKNRYGKRILPSASFFESYDDLYLKQIASRTGRHEEFNPEKLHVNTCSLYSNFGDRICLLGPFELSDFDTYDTPLSFQTPFRVNDNLLMGVEIHANATLNILRGNPYQNTSPLYSWFLLVPATLILGILLDRLSPLISAITFALAISLGLGVAYHLLHVWSRVVLISPFVLAFFLTWANETIINYYRKWAQANSTKQMFQRFVAADVVQYMLENPEIVKPGGQSAELTVFFSDVAGFTSISEALSPEDLVILLNEYLGTMTDLLFQFGGTLDKFIGDAVMAFWNFPKGQDDHAVRACLCAISMQAKIIELQRGWAKRGLPKVAARAGINSARVVVGYMGSEKAQMNFTCMGDGVNLASRLEGANKEYGTLLMISDATYQRAKEAVTARFLDYLAVKGKKEPVKVHELVCEKGKEDSDWFERVKLYDEGIALHLDRKWDEAIEAFEALIARWPEDGPSKTYITRCKEYKDNPPPEPWDGRYILTHK